MDAAWGQVTGIVPGYIGGRMLDDLLLAEKENGQIFSSDSLKDFLAKLNGATNGFGVFVTDFQIMKVDFPEEVYAQQNEHWKAKKQSIATVKEGDTQASHIRTHEKERAEALRDLILTIAIGLDRNKDDQFLESLILSMPGFLDQGLKDPVLRAYLATQKLETWEHLRKLSNPPQPPD
jgi:regulator of protease activity HflC (stomatin/prohibitin superfamily)